MTAQFIVVQVKLSDCGRS